MMHLSSPSFRDGGPIPKQHTVEGAELSPPLAWSDLPHGSRSLVLLLEDLDTHAPAGRSRPFVHWIVYNLQASSPGVALGANRTGLPGDARTGRNDQGRVGYSGPPADVDLHRCVFRLLALDTTLEVRSRDTPGPEELLDAIEGHVLGAAELTGVSLRETSELQPLRRPGA